MTTKQTVLTYICLVIAGYLFTWPIALLMLFLFFHINGDFTKEQTL